MIEPLFLARIGPRKRYVKSTSERTFKSNHIQLAFQLKLGESPIEPKPALLIRNRSPTRVFEFLKQAHGRISFGKIHRYVLRVYALVAAQVVCTN